MKEISEATKKNWKKLKINDRRMEKRANKRMSTKHIIPMELFKNKNNIKCVLGIIEFIQMKYQNIGLDCIIYNLVISYFKCNGLLNKEMISRQNNIKKIMLSNSNKDIVEEIINIKLPDDENDILGIIYQCLMTEGDKNEKGSYYTPKKIVDNMLSHILLRNEQKILDPCCGTGMFLMGVETARPQNIYGIDIDENAILISKANLIVKYKGIDFEPNIFKDDFIENGDKINEKFDYIVTNPPWGANLDNFNKNKIKEIKSGESFSYVIYRASKILNNNGKMLFLLPESFLNIKVHCDIRKYLIEKMSFNQITLYPSSFSGVVTKFISIEVENKRDEVGVINISDTKKIFFEYTRDVIKSTNYVIRTNTLIDKEIFQKIDRMEHHNLSNSKWALGIVTGNNKEKIKKWKVKNYEPIYTGKEISDYNLLECKNYIKYNRNEFQQVAPDEMYRAKEKLVYKFISKKITFAYDNKGSLFLNSANILIPSVEGMSIKTVMAFLNSTLFQYIYIQKFGGIKILRGNLEQLPFPTISSTDNEMFEKMVDGVLNGNNENKKVIEEKIYNVYGLTSEEIHYIEGVVNGKTNA